MFETLFSIRTRIAIVMLVTAVFGLLASYFIFSGIEKNSEVAASREKNSSQAQVIARQVAQGASLGRIRAFQSLLGDDGIIIYKNNQLFYKGGTLNNSKPVITSSVVSGAKVSIIGDIGNITDLSLELTSIVALVILLLFLSLITGTAVLVKSIREPIKRAILAADRVAAGDLSVRMGLEGPNEFQRLAKAFDGMAEQLERTEHQQRQFLADLAHEIATPVTTLVGITGGVLDGTIKTTHAREEANYLLETELERVRSLLDDIRNLGLLDSPRVISSEMVDLGSVCERVAERFEAIASKKGVKIVTNVRRIEINSNQRLIETILDNLVSNAIRYTLSDGKIIISTFKRGSEVVLSVKDNGIGIPKESQSHIFERFYRVDEARSRDQGGSGLGLSIARKAAVALGAKIELESALGSGSEFNLILPPQFPITTEIPSNSSDLVKDLPI